MDQILTLKTALAVQREGLTHPLLQQISIEADRLLVLDLCSLGAKQELFPEDLMQTIATHTLSDYHHLRQAALRLQNKLKTSIQEMHHDHDFAKWRQLHFKSFLKNKRDQEKKEKKHPKAYTDYLDAAQRKLFQAFWNTYRWALLYTAITGKAPVDCERHPHLQLYFAETKNLHASLAQENADLKKLKETLLALSPTLGLAYLQTMRSFVDLTYPLRGSYKKVRKEKEVQLEKHLASSFYPIIGYGYGRSAAYRDQHELGSVFKLVTAYQALVERAQAHKTDLNPLTLIDDVKGDMKSTSLTQVLGYTEQGAPILRKYKGGILPRSAYSGMGRLDILGALEQSSNLYFSILASEHLADPTNLSKIAHDVGFGQKTNIDLPGEIEGKVPEDLAHNRSALYLFAIGHHTFAVTPLQTAVMMSALATQGKVIKPRVVKILKGEAPVKEEDPFSSFSPFQRELSLIGINFPLFTAATPNLQETSIHYTPIEIERFVPFPPGVFNMLTEGMTRTVKGLRGSCRPSIMRNVYGHPTALRDYYELQNEILPKTGTAQVLYKQSIDAETPAYIRWHVSFAAISYPKHTVLSPHPFEDPELVVVILSKYGRAGREIAPMSAQIIKKWREIQKKYKELS